MEREEIMLKDARVGTLLMDIKSLTRRTTLFQVGDRRPEDKDVGLVLVAGEGYRTQKIGELGYWAEEAKFYLVEPHELDDIKDYMDRVNPPPADTILPGKVSNEQRLMNTVRLSKRVLDKPGDVFLELYREQLEMDYALPLELCKRFKQASRGLVSVYPRRGKCELEYPCIFNIGLWSRDLAHSVLSHGPEDLEKLSARLALKNYVLDTDES